MRLEHEGLQEGLQAESTDEIRTCEGLQAESIQMRLEHVRDYKQKVYR